jgi:hypothetical protein
MRQDLLNYCTAIILRLDEARGADGIMRVVDTSKWSIILANVQSSHARYPVRPSWPRQVMNRVPICGTAKLAVLTLACNLRGTNTEFSDPYLSCASSHPSSNIICSWLPNLYYHPIVNLVNFAPHRIRPHCTAWHLNS